MLKEIANKFILVCSKYIQIGYDTFTDWADVWDNYEPCFTSRMSSSAQLS